MTDEERQREHSLLEQERKRSPELFDTGLLLDTSEMLRWIGIEDMFGNLPSGHLKYMPQDFIVEEIPLDKHAITVDVEPSIKTIGGEGNVFHGELVKIDMTTLDAREALAKILGTNIANVMTAGLKDEIAITAQEITIHNFRDAAALEQLHGETFFVKNITHTKGVLKRGGLWGNRFIITVRTPHVFSEKEKKRIQQSLQDISENGFWNFFSFQRFAAPRLNGHVVGRHLLKGEYTEALFNLLFSSGVREEPYFRRIREEAAQESGNWQAIQERMRFFPSHFSPELQTLEYLKMHPEDVVGAFRKVPEQVRLWIYGYASFLFNKKLSRCIKEGEVPFSLPFITSRNKQDQDLYKEFLEEDGVRLNERIYHDFPFLRFAAGATPSFVQTLQKVKVLKAQFREKMLVIAFNLPKGAYATTFLAHLFQLSSEAPIPSGLNTTLIDAKKELGIGSLKETFARFRLVLEHFEKVR